MNAAIRKWYERYEKDPVKFIEEQWLVQRWPDINGDIYCMSDSHYGEGKDNSPALSQNRTGREPQLGGDRREKTLKDRIAELVAAGFDIEPAALPNDGFGKILPIHEYSALFTARWQEEDE